jgi:alpha-beta hydrolase superfamily lysophospholipase
MQVRAAALVLMLACAAPASPAGSTTVWLRGRPQTLHLAGCPGRPPIVVSSGDGGWIHLAPRVAAFLARQGYFAVGLDVRAYLASFTTGPRGVSPREVQDDFLTLVETAASGGAPEPPVLVGVSEGAALSVLAATAPAVKGRLGGVVALGLPDVAELAWHWRDVVIYFTHRAPDEPAFSTRAVVAGVAPLPLVAIHSTHDEYVPREEVEAVMARAREPKQLWFVEGSDHRFSGNPGGFEQRLLDALAWIRRQRREAGEGLTADRVAAPARGDCGRE